VFTDLQGNILEDQISEMFTRLKNMKRKLEMTTQSHMNETQAI